MGRYLLGRQRAAVRHPRPLPSQAGVRKAHRRPAQHGLAEMGRGTTVLHELLLANWDEKGADNEQFLKAYTWDGKVLTERFAIQLHQGKTRAAAHHAFRCALLVYQGSWCGAVRGALSSRRLSWTRFAVFAAMAAPGPAWGAGIALGAPPAPGSYRLPCIESAGDGSVVTSHGEATTLHRLYAGRIVVLSLIYTHCADAQGCPWASFTLAQTARGRSEARLEGGLREPELRSGARFT